MTRLEAAFDRLSAALDLLESRLADRTDASSNDENAMEFGELQRENDELRARIAALEEQSTTLAGVSETVETRLDGAIAEIRAVLGRG